MKFNFIFLGQSILRYEVPLDIFVAINQIYESNFNRLAQANRQLVGKIQNDTYRTKLEKLFSRNY
jgi:hypothetical protein